MSARAGAGGSALSRIATFACIGVINTGLYIAVSYGLHSNGVASAALAGLLGYCSGAIFSYVANRRMTFASRAPHGPAIMKFAIASLAGLVIGVGLPFVMTDIAGMRVEIPVLLAALSVPVMNYLLLSLFVFANQSRSDA